MLRVSLFRGFSTRHRLDADFPGHRPGSLVFIDDTCRGGYAPPVMRRILIISAFAVLVGAGLSGAQSKTHDLKLEPKNVHWGYYDAKIPPVLRIASGDTVRVETMIAGGLERVRLDRKS